MKKTTRTIEISIKTDEHLVIRQRRDVTRMWCARCGKETGAVSLRELEDLARARQSEDAYGQVHFIETAEELLVCLNSFGS